MFTKKMGMKLVLQHLSKSIGWMLLAMGYSVTVLSLFFYITNSLKGNLTLLYVGIGFGWGVVATLWSLDVKRKLK